MRRWIDLFETPLMAVTGQDVRDIYASAPKDLETLLSAYDADSSGFLDIDWSPDAERVKQMLRPLANQELTLYRGIRGKVDTHALGIHWSLDPERSEEFGQTLITAKVSPDAVDWVGTVARAIHWWEDEHEITLFREMPITIVSIEDRAGIDPTEGPMIGHT